MNPIKNRERILEAIDQLRRRKARPDIQRICNYLFRRFSVSSVEARSDLQWCVENDIVLKVEYKGSISYRNAAKKYSHVKRDSDGSADNKANRKFAQLLTNAFGELVVQEPDYLEYGVPAEEIINNILSKDSVRYTRKYISILIEKEVENGGLIKMENDKYLMGPTKEEGRPSDDIKPRKKPGPKPGFKRERPENMDSDEKKSESGTVRVGGRRKVSTVCRFGYTLRHHQPNPRRPIWPMRSTKPKTVPPPSKHESTQKQPVKLLVISTHLTSIFFFIEGEEGVRPVGHARTEETGTTCGLAE